MSITINIYYKGPLVKDFVKEMISSGIVDKIRKIEGNLRYEYFYPIEDDNTILLIDKWKNQEALDYHHQSEIMEEIIKLRKKYDLSMKVERYEDNETGIPESDIKYIIN